MCADRDSSASPGFRALLGRFVQGLLQYRVFQLLGAAWSYLMGLSGVSFFSFLPSAWVLHRSVGPDEFPEMLEALGLRSGPWEELGECLEELGPWKELLSPTMKADLEIMNPWTGYVSSGKEQESWDSAEMGTWHTKMKALWEPSTWEELEQEKEDYDECFRKSSVLNFNSGSLHKMKNESGLCDLDIEKNGAQISQSTLGMVSCILNPASGGVFTWLNLGNEHNLQKTDILDETSSHGESKVEIEHIRNKRLWFLQQNQSQDVSNNEQEVKEPAQVYVQNVSVLTEPPLLAKLDFPGSGCHHEHEKNISPDSQLLSDFDLDQSSVIDFSGIELDSKPCHPLSLLVPKPDVSDNTQNKYPPSPDQDQGYHSLEDWQCINITQALQSEGISPPNISGSVWNNDGAHVPAELSCSVMKDLEDDQDSDDMDSDLEEDSHAPALPVCTNKHIGYILGTIVSDDEEKDSGSSCEDSEDDDDDDGFDSEGSISATQSDLPVPEEVVLWTSSTDPYNPQNFTASLQTGPVAEVTSHPEDAITSDDEESWCDSDAVSDTEDEFSADEQENLKLWNGFLKSEDPYNPLFFKASVQTTERKRRNSDAATKHLPLVCSSASSCELTVSTTHLNDSRPLRVREKRCVSVEQSANVGRKKVTFYEHVAVYYVCNEEERKGHWEEFARDRCRFQRRIQETESVIGHCFTPEHRRRAWTRMHPPWGS